MRPLSAGWRSHSLALASLLLAAGWLTGCGCSPAEPADSGEAAEAAANAFSEGDFAKTLEMCKKSFELGADDANLAILMARAAIAVGDFAAARDGLERATRQGPDDVNVLQLTAQVAFATGDYDTARKAYSRLATDQTLPPEIRAIGWSGRGVVGFARLNAGKAPDEGRDQALTDFLQAILLDPNGAKSAYYHLGLLYAGIFHFNQAAVETLSEYARRMNDENDAHVIKARALIRSLNEEILAEQLNRAGSDRRNGTACTESMRKADAAMQRKQYKDALKHYETALKHDPMSYEAAERLANCYQLTAGSTQAGMENAYKYYVQAASLRTYPKPLIAAGDLAMKLKRPASAVSLYLRAITASPRNTTAIDGLIRALRACSKPKSAGIYQFYRDMIPKRK